MKITKDHRLKLEAYLKKFYSFYPQEQYTIFHFVKFFKSRLKKNKDAWMGVSGETGTGKSLFVLIAMILFGRRMSLVDNVAYIPKGNEIVEKFDKLKMQCMLVDEAAKEMRAVNWYSKAQQGVNVKAMTERFMNNWVFLNMPNFNEFTKSMRIRNLIFRAIVPYRTENFARVIIQRKSLNWRDEDPWSDEYANKLYKKMERKYKEITHDNILSLERKLPNTVMDFIVPNLELILPEITNEYERLKMESRKVSEVEDGEAKKNPYKDKYEDIMTKICDVLYYNKLGLGTVKVSQTEIAESIGVSMSTFRKYLVKR